MSMINIPVWMFLSSYQKLREILIKNHTIINMAHFGRGVFGSDFGSTSFVISKHHFNQYLGSYRRLFKKQGSVESVEDKEKMFLGDYGRYLAVQDSFSKIPGSLIAYWVSDGLLKSFENGVPLGDIADSRKGLTTGDNDRFIRFWYEPAIDNICFDARDEDEAFSSKAKWFPQNKGGDYRKWYGNNDFVVNWHNRGYEIRNFKDTNGKLRSAVRNT